MPRRGPAAPRRRRPERAVGALAGAQRQRLVGEPPGRPAQSLPRLGALLALSARWNAARAPHSPRARAADPSDDSREEAVSVTTRRYARRGAGAMGVSRK